MFNWKLHLILILAASGIVAGDEFTLLAGKHEFRFEGEWGLNGSQAMVRRDFDGEMFQMGQLKSLPEAIEARKKMDIPLEKFSEKDCPYLGTYVGKFKSAKSITPIELKLRRGEAYYWSRSGAEAKQRLQYGSITKDKEGNLNVELMATFSARPIIDLNKAITGKASAKKAHIEKAMDVIFKSDGSVLTFSDTTLTKKEGASDKDVVASEDDRDETK